MGPALLAVQKGDVSAAAEHYSVSQHCPSTLSAYSTNHRAPGLLAHAFEQLDGAVGHFEEGLVFRRKSGCRPELTWTCCDYADTLLQRDSSGDREQAMSLLDEVLNTSRELGMRPLTERILNTIHTASQSANPR